MTDGIKKILASQIQKVRNVYLKAEEAYERIKICESCDKYIRLAKICSECKCFMPSKTRLRFAECPIGKWLKVELDADNT